MATILQTTNSSGARQLDSGDEYYLARGAIQSGTVYDGTASGSTALHGFINGELYAALNLNNSNYEKHITVGTTGLIQHKATSGAIDINFSGSDESSLTNNGEISVGLIQVSNSGSFILQNNGIMSEHGGYHAGSDNYLSFFSSPNFEVINTGVITTNGVTLDASSSNGRVTNTGEMVSQTDMFSTNSSLDVVNSGDMISGGDLVNSSGLVQFENSGFLSAEGDIVDTSRDVQFQNTGQITGDGYLVRSEDRIYYQNSGQADVSSGLYSTGDFILLENSGTLSVETGYAAYSTTSAIYVYNTGDIISNGPGLRYNGSGTLNNQGRIDVNSTAIFVAGSFNNFVSTGTITGFRGIDLGNGTADNDIINSGQISGLSDSAIEGNDLSGVRIINTGELTSGGNFAAIHLEDSTDQVKLKNDGIISANAELAVSISNDAGDSTFGHILVNSGQILGGILLSAGDDVYNGRGGFVSGSIDAGAGDDIITGGQVADIIDGGSGANEIRALGGDDFIVTGDDADLIIGGAGDDDITSGHGDDTIRGGDGEDVINGQGGVDFIQGGNGNDYIRMGNGDGQRGEGNAGDDVLVGGNQRDVLLGGADEDELIGNNGNDVLRGGIGDDVLEGGNGDDRLIGNRGEDTAVFSGDSSDYTFTLNGNGTVDVFDTVGTDGTDNLFGVELVEFTDGTYLLIDLI